MLRSALCLLLTCAAPAVAGLHWEKPWQEFRRTPEDRRLETTFAFQNTGKTPVKIKTVRTSCGCTTARLDKKEYAPGERGQLTTKFDFGSRTGAQRKMITVRTDDGAQQELNFVVFIKEALTVSPALVLWRIGEPATARSVRLEVAPGIPLRIRGVSSSNPRLPATFQARAAGEAHVVSIQPADTAQREAGQITVQTDYPPDAPRAYTIHARIK